MAQSAEVYSLCGSWGLSVSIQVILASTDRHFRFAITGALAGQVLPTSASIGARYFRSTLTDATDFATLSLPSISCNLEVGGSRELKP